MATKYEIPTRSQDDHLEHYYVDMAKSLDARKEEKLELIRVSLVTSQASKHENE